MDEFDPQTGDRVWFATYGRLTVDPSALSRATVIDVTAGTTTMCHGKQLYGRPTYYLVLISDGMFAGKKRSCIKSSLFPMSLLDQLADV